MIRWTPALWATGVVGLVAAAGFATRPGAAAGASEVARADSQMDVVLHGRYLVISHDCAGCHGGIDPSAPGWLAGVMSPLQEFQIGACDFHHPNAQPCFTTRPRNLTPDNTTGLGRYTERQIFNALRYGLRLEDTPDVTITSMVPGQGNFPLHPHYLAPPMPWTAWRHMPDADLWAIAAYLHRAVKPVVNRVLDSDGPPDFWVSAYTVDRIGVYPSPAFPAASEQIPK